MNQVQVQPTTASLNIQYHHPQQLTYPQSHSQHIAAIVTPTAHSRNTQNALHNNVQYITTFNNYRLYNHSQTNRSTPNRAHSQFAASSNYNRTINCYKIMLKMLMYSL